MVTCFGNPITIVVSDVDGVLTDGGYYVGPGSMLLKKFHCHDSVAQRLITDAGLRLVLVTSASLESFNVTKQRFSKSPVKVIHAEWCQKCQSLDSVGIDLRMAVAIGDCIDDLPFLRSAAVSFAPADAVSKVRGLVDVVLKRKGGEGCLLELASYLGLVNG